MKRSRTIHRRARGFLLMDMTMALMIGTVVLVSTLAAVAHVRQAETKLAATRATMRRLEAGLFALRVGENVDPGLKLERLPGTIDVFTWVRISTGTGQTPRASLVGLVPADRAAAIDRAMGGGQ